MAKGRRRGKRKRSRAAVLFSVIVVVLIIAATAFFYRRYGGSDQEMDPMTYFNLSSDTEAALIVDGARLDAKGRYINDQIYIDYDTVFSSINSGFYWEENSGTLYLTLQSGTQTWTEGDGTDAVVVQDGTPYLSEDLIEKNSDIDISLYDDPSRIVIVTRFDNVKTASAKKDSAVRIKGGPKSDIITRVKKGDRLTVGEELDNWTGVTTADGYVGYIRNSDITVSDETGIDHTTDDRFVYQHVREDGKVNLSWQQMENADANKNLSSLVQDAQGLTVVSPTWFRLTDGNGTLQSFADADYVTEAHSKGLKVWAVFSSFSTDEIDAADVMKTEEVRSSVISQIISAADQTGFDGINIDFESISEEETPQYLQFLRELSLAAHAKNMVLSVDNYVPVYTKHIKRREQAKFVDYEIIMGYDEHTTGSSEAGSVASIPFVEQGIKDTLEEVPADQVIDAVPFYTRVWTEEFGQETPRSQALGMDDAEKWASEHGITVEYDDSVGENTGSAESDNARYSVWLEDETALENKMKLIKQYDLAGVASWRLGFERSSVWEIIQKYIS